MKRYIHASINSTVQNIIDKVAKKYELLYTTPEADYVLKGDSFAFKVNDHNVYRAIIDTKDSTLYLQCIAVVWYNDQGKEYYDEAVDYKDAVVDCSDMFDTLVRWVDECEADDSNFTEYEEREKVIKANKDTDRAKIAQLVSELSANWGAADIVDALTDIVPTKKIIRKLQSLLGENDGPIM